MLKPRQEYINVESRDPSCLWLVYLAQLSVYLQQDVAWVGLDDTVTLLRARTVVDYSLRRATDLKTNILTSPAARKIYFTNLYTRHAHVNVLLCDRPAATLNTMMEEA